MGKSRLVDEVGKKIFTISICLKKANDGGYPRPDSFARDTLLEIMNMSAVSTDLKQQTRLMRFFCAVFDVAKEKLKALKDIHQYPLLDASVSAEEKYKLLAHEWRSRVMSNEYNREAFYASVRDKISDMKDDTLSKYAKSLKTYISSLSNYKNPPILLVFDEVGTIVDQSKASRKESSNALGVAYLLRSLNADNIPGIVVTALSSYTHISDLAPPVSSLKEITGQISEDNKELKMGPPFIELPFDLFVPPIDDGRMMLSNVCNADFISHFGRALFRLTCLHGEKGDIVKFAVNKLVNNIEDTNSDILTESRNTAVSDSSFIALLNIRVQLSSSPFRDLIPTEEEKQIASHLRNIICIPNHREYIFSGHPSEPLVAEAAAQLLRIPTCLKVILRGLNQIMNFYGGEDKGDRGELITRFLLTAAHDRALAVPLTGKSGNQLRYTRPVKVVDFLKALISDKFHSAVLESLPVKHCKDELALETAFAKAYINFTHFLKGGDSGIANTSFAWKALVRSAAIQCCPTQPNIDIIIPIVFSTGGPDKARLSEDNVSAILIQVKNRKRPQVENIDAVQVLDFFGDKNRSVTTGSVKRRPYIAILVELGDMTDDNPDKKPKHRTNYVKVTNRQSTIETRGAEDAHPKYGIKIYGLHEVYKDIDDDVVHIAENLLAKGGYTDVYPFKSDTVYEEAIRNQKVVIGRNTNLLGN